MPPKPVRCTGLLLLAAIVTLLPVRAEAHPVRLGLLSLDEDAEGVVQMRLHLSGTERQPSGGRPVLPAQCRATSPPERIDLRIGSELRQSYRCEGGLAGARVGVAELPRGGVQVLLRHRRAGVLVFEAVLDDAHSTRVLPRNVSGVGVFTRYLHLGFVHILSGFDHLLFVLGLLLLVVGRRRLLWTITSFTLGHSVTLALATLGLLHVPPAATEAAIALSILLLAVELTRSRADPAVPASPPPSLTRRYPWLVAGVFGLLHGLGFAGALSEVGLPADSIPAALFSFNVGVELGQLTFVFAILSVASLWARWRRGASVAAFARRWALPYGLGAASCYLLLTRVASFFAA